MQPEIKYTDEDMQLLTEEDVNQVTGGIFGTVGELFDGLKFPPIEMPMDPQPTIL